MLPPTIAGVAPLVSTDMRFGYRDIDPASAGPANRDWWSRNAQEYLADHGSFLGDADFCWCPEGIRESQAHLLGPLDTLREQAVLEVGAGAAQCSRWLTSHGVDVIATDISEGMLAQARALDQRTGITVRTRRADARDLPFADSSFDVVFTAFGAVPFVPDAAALHREVARVLHPGGRWLFSVTHPFKWVFPDDPGPGGLTVVRPYFDRTPYVELDDAGAPAYAEFHRTIGDHIRDLRSAGFTIRDLIEPQWPSDLTQTWGSWSPMRGALFPSTAIFVTSLEAKADGDG